MPIPGIEQPEFLTAGEGLRLRRFSQPYDFAFPWYQDAETVFLVDGVKEPYTRQKLDRMYRWLDAHGDLYFIEVWQEGVWLPIGDVTFWQDNLPIVIGNQAFRGRGIGRQVIARLIERGRELGYPYLAVNEIYDYNLASRKCFESLGFTAAEKTGKGRRYILRFNA